jgi:hypothetical protein
MAKDKSNDSELSRVAALSSCVYNFAPPKRLNFSIALVSAVRNGNIHVAIAGHKDAHAGGVGFSAPGQVAIYSEPDPIEQEASDWLLRVSLLQRSWRCCQSCTG